jgi:hypothetical protein
LRALSMLQRYLLQQQLKRKRSKQPNKKTGYRRNPRG